MKISDWLLGIAHCTIWGGSIFLCETLFADSPARSSYGMLCAWWATIYMASVLGTRWRAVVIFLFGMTLALVIDAAGSWNLLYHDSPVTSSSGFVVVAGLQWLVWASAFVINSGVMWVRDRVRRI